MKKIIILLLSSFLIFSAIGCNSSSSSSTDESSTSNENVSKNEFFHDAVSQATYDDYLSLKVDQTYDDATKLLGDPNSATHDGDKTTYNWKAKNGGSISIVVENNIIISKSQGNLKTGYTTVTLEQFNKLTDNITLDEVKDILGDGKLILEENGSDGSSDFIKTMYAYYNDDLSNIILTFRDGKLYGKSNNNLK